MRDSERERENELEKAFPRIEGGKFRVSLRRRRVTKNYDRDELIVLGLKVDAEDDDDDNDDDDDDALASF